jgi:hypothetical protein
MLIAPPQYPAEFAYALWITRKNVNIEQFVMIRLELNLIKEIIDIMLCSVASDFLPSPN